MPNKEVFVVVADASGARFFKTHDRGAHIEPAGDTVHAPPNPKSSDQMTDRLGRSQSSTTPSRAAIAPKTDPHRAGEDAFAKALAKHLDTVNAHELLIFAAPAFLGALRKELSKPVAAKIAHEIDRDLYKAPIEDVRTHVRKALFPD